MSIYLSNGPLHGRNCKGAAANTPNDPWRLSDATDLSPKLWAAMENLSVAS